MRVYEKDVVVPIHGPIKGKTFNSIDYFRTYISNNTSLDSYKRGVMGEFKEDRNGISEEGLNDFFDCCCDRRFGILLCHC